MSDRSVLVMIIIADIVVWLPAFFLAAVHGATPWEAAMAGNLTAVALNVIGVIINLVRR